MALPDKIQYDPNSSFGKYVEKQRRQERRMTSLAGGRKASFGKKARRVFANPDLGGRFMERGMRNVIPSGRGWIKKSLFAVLFGVVLGIEIWAQDYWYVSTILLVLAGFFNLFSTHMFTRFLMGFLPLILAALSLPSESFAETLPGLNWFTFGGPVRLVFLGLLIVFSFFFIRKHDTGFKWSRVVLLGVVALFGYMETASEGASGYGYIGGIALNLSLLIVAGLYLFKNRDPNPNSGKNWTMMAFGVLALVMAIVGIVGIFDFVVPIIGVGTPGRFIMLIVLLLYMLFRRDAQAMYNQYYGGP